MNTIPTSAAPQAPQPLTVQSAPSNMPTFTSPVPAPATSAPSNPQIAPPQAAGMPQVHPLFQDSINGLAQVAQMGNQSQTPAQGGGGFFNDVKDLGTGLLKGAVETAYNIMGLGARAADFVTGEKRDYTPPKALQATNAA